MHDREQKSTQQCWGGRRWGALALARLLGLYYVCVCIYAKEVKLKARRCARNSNSNSIYSYDCPLLCTDAEGGSQHSQQQQQKQQGQGSGGIAPRLSGSVLGPGMGVGLRGAKSCHHVIPSARSQRQCGQCSGRGGCVGERRPPCLLPNRSTHHLRAAAPPHARSGRRTPHCALARPARRAPLGRAATHAARSLHRPAASRQRHACAASRHMKSPEVT